jgi:hypothetical protein
MPKLTLETLGTFQTVGYRYRFERERLKPFSLRWFAVRLGIVKLRCRAEKLGKVERKASG